MEIIRGRDWLEFAGIPLVPCIAISREQQFAEKLHAYTRQRERPNSRVKDVVDMALLVKMGLPESPKLKEAIQMTFAQRGGDVLAHRAVENESGEVVAGFRVNEDSDRRGLLLSASRARRAVVLNHFWFVILWHGFHWL